MRDAEAFLAIPFSAELKPCPGGLDGKIRNSLGVILNSHRPILVHNPIYMVFQVAHSIK